VSLPQFPVLSEIRLLKAKLAVSEARAARLLNDVKTAQASIHRDFCHQQLAVTLLALKDEYNYSWDSYKTALEAPCSTEMLKSVALGRKRPSDSLYSTLCTCLRFAAIRNGYQEPSFPSLGAYS